MTRFRLTLPIDNQDLDVVREQSLDILKRIPMMTLNVNHKRAKLESQTVNGNMVTFTWRYAKTFIPMDCDEIKQFKVEYSNGEDGVFYKKSMDAEFLYQASLIARECLRKLQAS